MNDTIAAIATPYGSGGIGVIRISGPQAFDAAKGIFSKTKHKPAPFIDLHSKRVEHGFIFHPEKQEILDEILLIPMKGPGSYTAEDVIEIQAHSGSVVLRSILDLLITRGIRLAEPGEFTKRAFLNGRIDLTQAEAVADIINAKSARSLKIASSQNAGGMGKTIRDLRQKLIDFLAVLEAGIDFPDDVADVMPGEKETGMVNEVLLQCRQFIHQHDDAVFLKDGVRLTICGAPNVGKSSLMNRLLEKEKSIVTAVPGTTRDPIEEALNLEGIPIVVTDTAGIHKTDDLVEIIGIEKAKDRIDQSDLILFMKEAGSTFSENEFKRVVPGEKKAILVVNKIDLDHSQKIQLPEKYSQLPLIEVSALLNKGISKLKQKIIHLCISQLDTHDSSIIPNLRHKKALQETVDNLERAALTLESGQEEDLVAMDIKAAIHALGTITGETASLDILDTIFNNFCIGK